MIEIPAELGDDSEDFSDEEVALAVALPSVDRVIAHLRELRCSQCGQSMVPIEHALRRRVPSLYWRMRLRCAVSPKAHHDPVLVIIRADWLQESS
jgi:hypothetical protein